MDEEEATPKKYDSLLPPINRFMDSLEFTQARASVAIANELARLNDNLERMISPRGSLEVSAAVWDAGAI